MDLLSLVGNAGIILNPDKFQFAKREVDFAGFNISEERIEPLPKFFDAIKHFPTPTSTTDIRSWFGLVNQVANYAQLRPFMEKFRPFLSPRCPFEWTPQLDDAFKFSKQSIVNAIEEGVEIFDHERPTCLYTDWSKKDVGYFPSAETLSVQLFASKLLYRRMAHHSSRLQIPIRHGETICTNRRGGSCNRLELGSEKNFHHWMSPPDNCNRPQATDEAVR